MTVVIDGTLGIDTIQANTVTSAKIVDGSVAAVDLAQPLTLGTAQNTTSGTSIDFTGIPSWVKRVTIAFRSVSTNANAHLLIQIGAGSVQSTGYLSASFNGIGVTSTAGFIVEAGSATLTQSGTISLISFGSNVWVSSHSIGRTNDGISACGGGDVALSGTLDRIRLTTTNGTDTFDAGSVNILYEG